METQLTNEKKEFVTPTKREDFPDDKTVIEHTYENGSKVAFVLLRTGDIARVREGKGIDVENATAESDGDKKKYLTAMIASTVTINGKSPNMFELADLNMKDYMAIQTVFAGLNF